MSIYYVIFKLYFEMGLFFQIPFCFLSAAVSSVEVTDDLNFTMSATRTLCQ